MHGRYGYANYDEEAAGFHALTPSSQDQTNCSENNGEKYENGNGGGGGGSEDCDENFGEIIKKSMVETVSA